MKAAVRVKKCNKCNVQPVESEPAGMLWKLRCPACGKTRGSIVSRERLIAEWNQSNKEMVVWLL